jgi:hypothetical protein
MIFLPHSENIMPEKPEKYLLALFPFYVLAKKKRCGSQSAVIPF